MNDKNKFRTNIGKNVWKKFNEKEENNQNHL